MLGLAVTNHIFATYPKFPEGQLAKLRAAVVSSSTLSTVARRIDLGQHLLLGKGEHASGGSDKTSILADALEAVFGAIYLDGGWHPCADVILTLMADEIAGAAAGPGTDDFKTRLQELVARYFESLPTYEHQDRGPDHDKTFYATVLVQDQARGSGEGRSKKEAEQAAAAAAWESLSSELEAQTAGSTT